MTNMTQEQLNIIYKSFNELLEKKQKQLDVHYKNAEVLMNHLGENTPKTKSLLVATMTQIDCLEHEISSLKKDIERVEIRLQRL